MSIFISIASYCDPTLFFTLRQAVKNAHWPDQLHFGVIDQSPVDTKHPKKHDVFPARLSCTVIDPIQARGVCWARSLAMTLYDGEDWYFQIDSHMDFEPNWDERLISQALGLLKQQPKFVISSYPTAFTLSGENAVHQTISEDVVLVHVVSAESQFEPEQATLSFEARATPNSDPIQGFHLAAGCLFAPGHIVDALPYDPHFYFHGEEQAYALRLFTHGWTIFHTAGLPVYHLYNDSKETQVMRSFHWDRRFDQMRNESWWKLEKHSQARMNKLINENSNLGVYGLGTQRSLADYAEFCGIDYLQRVIEQRAYGAFNSHGQPLHNKTPLKRLHEIG